MKKSAMLAALLSMIAIGCNRDSGDLSVQMTDSPGNYARLQVEIDEVEVYSESEGWVALETETESVNVVELNNGATAELATGSKIKAGNYSKTRILFGSENYVEVYDQNGNTQRKELKFDDEASVEIEMEQEIMAQSDNEIVLDFHIEESVEEQSGDTFKFEPSMKVKLNFDTGVEGTISGQGQFRSFVELDGDDEDYSTYTDANGNFKITGMQEGDYDVVVHLPKDVAATLGLGLELEVDEVVVTNGEIKSMGTISL